MGFYQNKKLLLIKGNNHQNEETNHRMGENLCKLFIGQRINIQNILNSKKLNTKRTNNPINEGANELNRQFSEEVQMAINT
jgi:hypothetical protein